MDIFRVKEFNALSPEELYAILRLRCRIFIVEQRCLFVDPDNFDQHCLHIMLYRNNKLIAYARVAGPDVIYREATIGRVSSEPEMRGQGLGRLIMNKAMEVCTKSFPDAPIRLMAQYYLFQFYKSYGFRESGEIYIEDDIEHIDMYLNRG